MSAESPVFGATCDELERRTDLARLESRGTVRIAIKSAGLDAGSVDAEKMAVVLRRVLPAELESRGVANAADICEQIVAEIEGIAVDAADDRAGAAAATMGRFGS